MDNFSYLLLRAEWFGMLHSWADSKKKSNLVLSVFKPGVDSVPWLGSFKMLNCLPTHTEPIPGHVVQQLPGLPVPVSDKKSYSSTSSSWLRQATLQADVQKLLRYGRKLPEKLNVFYKVCFSIYLHILASVEFYFTPIMYYVTTQILIIVFFSVLTYKIAVL